MKDRLAFVSILILVVCSTALADWAETFYSNYLDKGIDQAVIVALSEGLSPDQIIKTALPITDLEQDKLIKALFCGLALPGSIYDAAENNGITDKTVSEGYQLALGQCAGEMEENLDKAVDRGNQPSDHSPSAGGRSTLASPWTFR